MIAADEGHGCDEGEGRWRMSVETVMSVHVQTHDQQHMDAPPHPLSVIDYPHNSAPNTAAATAATHCNNTFARAEALEL